MSTEEIKKSGEQKMDKCISQLKKELTTIRTGRANPLILDKVLVDYYGAPTKLNQMAQISVQDGTTLVITPLTADRRKELSKEVKAMGETAKVAVRNVRRDLGDEIKKIEKAENLPEDAVRDAQDSIQKLTDKFIKIIDETVSEKEKEVMTV